MECWLAGLIVILFNQTELQDWLLLSVVTLMEAWLAPTDTPTATLLA